MINRWHMKANKRMDSGCKPTLLLPHAGQFMSWNETLHNMLEQSGLFNVSRVANLPKLAAKSCGRVTNCLSVVEVDGTQIAIDTWDTQSPTDTAYKAGMFDPGQVLGDVAMVLKIQYRDDEEFWDEFRDNTMIDVSSWTIFPTREFELGCFEYDANASHIYTGTVTGANRYGRGEYFDAANDAEDFYTLRGGQKDTHEQFVNVLKTTRWGISLRGKRGTDGKNRREIEFASCGMPLALNYMPCYPFPFEPGKHYIYMRSARDMLALRDIDPQPYADAARQTYEKFWSAKGMAQMFLDLTASRREAARAR